MEKIIYDGIALRAIFKRDFKQIQHLYRKGEFKQIFRLRQSTGIIVVEDFINYAEGTNNWRHDHTYHFEQRLLESNPRFQDFKQFLVTNDYKGFSKVEIGTMWVIALAMFDELLNMGFADLDRSASANSFAEMVMKYEKNQKRKARRMGSVVDNETAGRKYNVYNQSYMTWIQRLLPWLRKHKSTMNQKEALIFIGFLLEVSGHDEFRRQYGRGNRQTRKYVKVKSQSRWKKFEIKTEDVSIPYRDYLHNRMKTIMKRSKTVPVPATSA
ncbi:MAG: hypothetical protein JNK44_18020 [Cyclobacteriaceae bacterium]|nr:hypothetical protein [Cyclobacteriaceae bacterium]